MTPNHRPLTPEAFAAACRIARPTTHLHGWHSRDLGEMVEHLVAERDRAESRLACWALSAFFRAWRWELRSTRCACGHVGYAHRKDGGCRAGSAYVHDARDCGCTAFVAAFTAPTPDQRAAAAECGDVSGGRWRA